MNRRRRFGIALTTLLAAVAVFSSWFVYELAWKHQRQQARDWLAAQTDSWYAPSLPGRVKADAPWTLRLLGEEGVVTIGMDVDQFNGPVPYSAEALKNLFPEAKIDYSIGGRLVLDQRDP